MPSIYKFYGFGKHWRKLVAPIPTFFKIIGFGFQFYLIHFRNFYSKCIKMITRKGACRNVTMNNSFNPIISESAPIKNEPDVIR